MDTAIKTPTLDHLIEDFQQSIADAADQHDWQTALNATFNGLLWRAVRLAIRLQIVPASFNPEISWKLTALQLRSICGRALAQTVEVEDLDYRIEVVSDLLNALMDVAAALEAGHAKTNDGAFRLTISAANLGRCELMLGFAEEGFWEQIYLWRSRKVGRPPGHGEWKDELAAAFQKWIDQNPSTKVEARIDWIDQWLAGKGRLRDRSTAKTIYYEMKKTKLTVIPAKPEKVRMAKKLD